jgi:hypothetical protein
VSEFPEHQLRLEWRRAGETVNRNWKWKAGCARRCSNRERMRYRQDLSRVAFEAIALKAYRERKISTSQLRRLLGFESRYELDGFLKQHEVWLEYTWQDLEQDRETHPQLGL